MAVSEVFVIANVTVVIIYVSLFLPRLLVVVIMAIMAIFCWKNDDHDDDFFDFFLNDDDDNDKTLGNIYIGIANGNLWSLIMPSLGPQRSLRWKSWSYWNW